MCVLCQVDGGGWPLFVLLHPSAPRAAPAVCSKCATIRTELVGQVQKAGAAGLGLPCAPGFHASSGAVALARPLLTSRRAAGLAGGAAPHVAHALILPHPLGAAVRGPGAAPVQAVRAARACAYRGASLGVRRWWCGDECEHLEGQGTQRCIQLPTGQQAHGAQPPHPGRAGVQKLLQRTTAFPQ